MSPWSSAVLSGAREVQALRIEPTLHPQRWSLEGGAPAGGALSRCVHLANGRGLLWHADGELPLRSGDVVWLPAGRARALRAEAGTSGLTVGVTDALLAAAAGDRPDAAPLRAVSARPVVLGGVEPAARDELVRSLLAMEAEARSGASVSRPYLVAHLTLVLVSLWRLASHTGEAPAAMAPGQTRLLRFRHLVEAQFRHHWPLRRYAAELAISADRLHDLCVSTLGRPPLTLVHQRVVREACSLLAGTDLSVEHVAQDLGFGSGSHFSRFFRRWTGSAPGQWRAQTRALAAAGRPPAPTSYADWP